MNKCIIGAKIFIRDKDKVWACAEIIKEEGADIIVKTVDDELVKLKPTDDFYLRNIDIWDSSGLSAPSDLTHLTHLHEASVLHSLNVRFDIDEIYTFTGPILIAVNPFKNIENLYNDSILAKHIQPIKSKSPHIFATANSAYVGLCTNNKSQTILISGESGAGKTESTKYVMKFLACAGSDIKKRSLIERQVLESNPLLEAFGNAKTLRNDNSSRFGKYIELQFSIDNKNYVYGKLCGAKISTYLLEKVRVCDQQEGERNYHIFYQLCKAVEVAKAQLTKKKHTEDTLEIEQKQKQEEQNIEEKEENVEKKENEENEEKEEECFYEFPMTKKFREIENVKKCRIDFTNFKSHVYFRYLTKSSACELNEIDEQQEFESTLFAMQTIGITEEEQYQIFKILEGILYIGNILFNNDEYKEEAKILNVSRNDLRNAANLLDIDEKNLEDSLCFKTIIANKEYYKTPVNSETANDIRDALARAIYGCLFLKVVERTNESIGYVDNINLFCGVLDIFGFESFPLNSFEQICINYTNERLQQFFNNFIFKCEEKLYVEENINWDPLDFPDNNDCVDILESKPYGIFSMLDEECQIPSGKDKTFCSKIINKHKENKRFNMIKTDPESFIIVHFAGQVKYSSLGFLEKNKDQLSTDAQTVLLNSSNKYIAMLFEKYLRRSSDKRKFVTISSEFREQLNLLMTRIKETEPHFIRCIKPNSQNLPDVFDRSSVNEQLKYGGVLQAVKVSRAGYPVRLSHEDCVLDYKILLNKEEQTEFRNTYTDKSWAEKAKFVLGKLYTRKCIQEYVYVLKKLKEEAKEYDHYEKYERRSKQVNEKLEKEDEKIIEKKQLENKEEENSLIWSVGKTLCFFKSDAYNILSTMRGEFRSAQAIIIQKNYKRYAQRKLYILIKMKVLIIQKWFRMWLKKKEEEKKKIMNATEVICNSVYGYSIRKKFLYKKKCAVLIQSHVKGLLTRKKWKEYRRNYYASIIQATWKGYIEKKYFQSLKNATIRVQLCWKKILAIRQLRRLKLEAKEVGSLLSKNQILTKELQEERSKKMEVESKLLKALATIEKLTHEISDLEKTKKEQSVLICQLREKIGETSNDISSIPYLKKKQESNKNINIIYDIDTSVIHMNDINGEIKNEISLNLKRGYSSKNDKADKKGKDGKDGKELTEEHLHLLMNRIKKLEKDNFEYVKQNTTLNENYSKLLHIIAQLKSKNMDILNKWDNNNSALNKLISGKSLPFMNNENGVFFDIKSELTNNDTKSMYRRNAHHIDILLCGPPKVGKTSLLEDLFVRLGDEVNLNLLRKNKKNEKHESNSFTYNTYTIMHKSIKIKIVDCKYVTDRNMGESLFNLIKNSICIIVVFDSTIKESIKPALHMLQEASLVNLKKTTKLYLLENIFNEKINMNLNTNDITYALRAAKTCNAYYMKTLDLYDILNDYAKELMLYSNNYDNINKEKMWNDNTILNLSKSKSSPSADNYNYAFKVNELIAKFEKSSEIKIAELKDGHTNITSHFAKGERPNDAIPFISTNYNKNNPVNSVVNTIKAICGIQTKSNQSAQLLKESLPASNYVYGNSHKKYNSELGKGLQPICEMSISSNAPITYLAIGQDSLNKDYTLLAVGDKEGTAFVYKVFKSKMEKEMEMEMETGMGHGVNDNKTEQNGTYENKNSNVKEKKKEAHSKKSGERDKKNGAAAANSEGAKGEKSEKDKQKGDNITGNITIVGSNGDDAQECVQLKSRLIGHKKAITCIVFTLTEEKLVTSSIDKSIRVWDVASGFLLKIFSDSSATLSVLLFPTNPNIFLCSNCNSLLRIVNFDEGHLFQKIKVESEIRTLEIDDTGLNIFAGSKSGTIYVLEVIYNECVELKFRSVFSSASVTCIKFVPRRSLQTLPCIFVNSCDNYIGIIDCIYGNKGVLTTLSVRHRIRINHTLLPIKNSYSRYGGGWLISGSEDRNIYVVSLLSSPNYKPILLKYHKASVMSVVVNDNDTLMISGDTKGILVFWRRICT